MADTEPPPDSMEASRRIAGEISGAPVHGSPSRAFQIIARALLAERERCAKIADEWEPISVLLPLCDAQTNEAAVVAQVETGERIAAAIRKGD